MWSSNTGSSHLRSRLLRSGGCRKNFTVELFREFGARGPTEGLGKIQGMCGHAIPFRWGRRSVFLNRRHEPADSLLGLADRNFQRGTVWDPIVSTVQIQGDDGKAHGQGLEQLRSE